MPPQTKCHLIGTCAFLTLHQLSWFQVCLIIPQQRCAGGAVMKRKIRSIASGVALLVALTGSTAFAEQKGGNRQAKAYAGSGKTTSSSQTKARVRPSKVTDSPGATGNDLSILMNENFRQMKKDKQDDRQIQQNTYQRGVTTSPAKPCRTC